MSTVLSTNIAETVFIEYQGKREATGIYKYPVEAPLFLGKEEVKKDVVANRKVHGGVYKAVYAYSADDYPYWKEIYPELEWQWGMFGENLTMDQLNEEDLCIGDRYALGECILRVTQPREPCFKLGARFNDQGILQRFVDHKRSGIYFAVEKEGEVRVGDQLIKQEEHPVRVSIKEVYAALYNRNPDPEFISRIQANDAVPPRLLKRFIRA